MKKLSLKILTEGPRDVKYLSRFNKKKELFDKNILTIINQIDFFEDKKQAKWLANQLKELQQTKERPFRLYAYKYHPLLKDFFVVVAANNLNLDELSLKDVGKVLFQYNKQNLGDDMVFKNGWSIKELSPEECEKEGQEMGHCVGTYSDFVAKGKIKIFSLRDTKGRSHATIEVRDNAIFQIKGIANSLVPKSRIVNLIFPWIQKNGFSIKTRDVDHVVKPKEKETKQSFLDWFSKLSPYELIELSTRYDLFSLNDAFVDRGLKRQQMRRMSYKELLGLVKNIQYFRKVVYENFKLIKQFKSLETKHSELYLQKPSPERLEQEIMLDAQKKELLKKYPQLQELTFRLDFALEDYKEILMNTNNLLKIAYGFIESVDTQRAERQLKKRMKLSKLYFDEE